MAEAANAPQVGQPPAPAASESADSPAVTTLLAALEAQPGFAERLDDAARAHVREQLARLLTASAALAAQPLANGDEPDFVFSAHRGG